MNRELLEWTNETITNFWKFQSQFPERYFSYVYGDVIADRLKKHLKGRKNILDYGCGIGFLISHLLRLGVKVTGADFSLDSVMAVNAQFKEHPNFLSAFEIGRIEETRGSFDVILAIEVIEHLNDASLEQMMKNLDMLLTKGGKIIFTTPNDEDLLASSMVCPACDKVFNRWQHVRSWTQESLSQYLRKKSFCIAEIYTTDFGVSFKKNKTYFLLDFIRKVLKPGRKLPHLVAVCTR